uniref:Uncharacterized protein n=1 Tax=Mycobacterium riyadhense TaxID=486698 RepID=A0A653F2L3_9MYCO|nr:hypothetical protein BIN_B_05285 [Mycobacterium riyadhense]
MNAPDFGPARLDHFVSERLGMLRMNRADLFRRGGPNRSTLHKAATGSRTLSVAMLGRLDEALGWAPGSSATILKGGEPVCRHNQDLHVRTVLRAVEGLIDECHALLGDAKTLLAELLTSEGAQYAG